MKIDILITLAEKDFSKLPFVVESIQQNIDGVRDIYCISDITVPQPLSGVLYFLEKDVLNFDFNLFEGKVKARKGWYIQQYLKLFQEITPDDYLVVDSDIYFNRKINIIENGKPSFLFGTNYTHPPYFKFMWDVFKLKKEYHYSFINEVMYFKREYLQHLLKSRRLTKDQFFRISVKVLNTLNAISGFSEYELYGNYVTKYFPQSYNYTYVKTVSKAKPGSWSVKELRNYINLYKGQDVDILKMHSWTFGS